MRPRDNPFAVDRLHALRYRGLVAADLWQGRSGALVGPEGSGKTTLLLELQHHLESLGLSTIWIQLRRDARSLSLEHRALVAAPHDVCFVDGADLLPWLDRRWLRRHARTILGTLHAPGWLPTLATLSTSPALLDDLVVELTGRGCPDRDALYARHRGNLRTALFELYGLAAREHQDAVSAVTRSTE